MSRFVRLGFVAVAGSLLMLSMSASFASGDGGGIRAEPVRGKPVASGKRLWVFVHEANGSKKPAPACATDINTQTGYSLFGKAKLGGLSFKLNPSGIPTSISTTAQGAITDGFGAWDAVDGGSSYFSFISSGGASRPAEDGINTVGWARLVPQTVLAATWVWQDEDGRVTEADIFFNNKQPWGVFTSCGSGTGSYEVGNIATHEIGHTLALDHVSDSGRQATMYPSAPKNEVIKRTLTAGDESGFTDALKP